MSMTSAVKCEWDVVKITETVAVKVQLGLGLKLWWQVRVGTEQTDGWTDGSQRWCCFVRGFRGGSWPALC